MDLLELDHKNLIVALEWSLANDIGTGLKLGGSLGGFWLRYSYHVEGDRYLQALLAQADDQPPSRHLADALFWAYLLLRGTDWRNREILIRGIEVCESVGYTLRLFELRQFFAGWNGDIDGATDLIAEAGRALPGSDWSTMLCVHADMLAGAERYEEARRYAEKAVQTGQGSIGWWEESLNLEKAGYIARKLGDFPAARRYLWMALACSQHHHDKVVMSLVQFEFAACLPLTEETLPEKIQSARAALSTFYQLEELRRMPEVVEELAGYAQFSGRKIHAIQLLCGAEQIAAEVGLELYPMQQAERVQSVAELRNTVGEHAFDVAWDEVLWLSTNDIVDLALNGE